MTRKARTAAPALVPEVAAARRFAALVSGNGAVADSARINAEDTAREEGFPVGSLAYWTVAIATAEMLLDV
jgi:hypothetical protein